MDGHGRVKCMGGHDECMVCGPIVGTPSSEIIHFERWVETHIVSLVE